MLRQFGVAAGLAFVVAAGAAAGVGEITTVAGAGQGGGNGGDGGPATAASLNNPLSVAALAGGGFLIADSGNDEIRRVSASGIITTVAGTGLREYNGDGIPAIHANIASPDVVATLPEGGYVLLDSGNGLLRRVSPAGTITTIAKGWNQETGMSLTRDGGLLVGGYFQVRFVSRTGRVRLVAGNGGHGLYRDGARAVATNIYAVYGVAALPDGGFLISGGTNNPRVYRVTRRGIIHRVAGTGTDGFTGDGGPARRAELSSPMGLAPLANGGFLVADQGNGRIRYVSPNGTITTIAGVGIGYTGDGGPARKARMSPVALALEPDGDILEADSLNHIRVIKSTLRPAAVLRTHWR